MKLDEFTDHVKKSYVLSELESSKLAYSSIGQHILGMDGMSGKKWRHFLNNVTSMKGCKHLEIGTWAGSTFCSAIYANNELDLACTVDNSSQFGDVADRAKCAIEFTYASTPPSSRTVMILKKDYRNLLNEVSFADKFDIYYFDGPHEYNDQYEGILMMKDLLNEERCLILVDDWNWDEPRNGTLNALEELGREIVWSKTITTELEDGPKPPEWFAKNRRQNSDWHNGVGIFVLGGKK